MRKHNTPSSYAHSTDGRECSLTPLLLSRRSRRIVAWQSDCRMAVKSSQSAYTSKVFVSHAAYIATSPLNAVSPLPASMLSC